MINSTDTEWWRTAVIYQVYPRSFNDSDGDGTGDLAGITSRLDHLSSLGVDAVWLSPFYPSPQRDGGYDVANYRDVDPEFGTLNDFDGLVATAHGLGIRVIVDLVPNHCSSDHPLFQEALASAPGSAARAKFHFRVGQAGGETPPNDWQSMFGGPAWTRVVEADGSPGEWYLHLFDRSQPDWNWDNSAVRADFELTLRFWLDRHVDGFRVDVCDAMVKAEGLPNWPHLTKGVVSPIDGVMPPMWDQEGIHEIFREWREVLDSYSGTRMLCAEAWLQPERTARIVRPGEMNQAFNFAYLEQAWDAPAIRRTIETSLSANDAVGAPTTWVLSNHDVMRHASRYGYDTHVELESGVGAEDPQPDRALGLRRARAATALMLALPGSAYLYQGEELGMPEATDLPDGVRQDPVWERSGHLIRGRDGCRIPLPWTNEAASFGFSTSATTWLPMAGDLGSFSVEAQDGVAGSTLEFYRAALALRRSLGWGQLTWNESPDELIDFSRGGVRVIANVSSVARALPQGCEVLLASGPLEGGTLPGDTTVWVR
ncbi:MAG: alpha amylase catalytic region [Microbacteriaceae bacterium]|nr:alpha amylase catalytic region [Microbacteriaceae bacterium]